MSWTELIAGLAGALSTASAGRPPVPPPPPVNLRRLPPARYEVQSMAEAELETRRMMEEATREMARDLFDAEVAPLQKRVVAAEAKVADIDATVLTRLGEMERLLDAINLKALDAERLEKRLNLMLGLGVALFLMTLWFGLRSL